MNKNSLASWFFEGGAVAIPKKLIGLSEMIGLDHKDLGQITYILYCDNKIAKEDKFSMNAVRGLKRRGLISLDEGGDFYQVNFDPLFELIEKKLGINSSNEKDEKPEEKITLVEYSYSDIIKKIEASLAIFLTIREKTTIQEVVQKYLWDYDLVAEMFIDYHKKFKRFYVFEFYCQMAYGYNVKDMESLKKFQENFTNLDYKIVEVKKRLGHRRNYTEVEKEAYLKWTNLWKFPHEMVLLAVDQTLSAKDPTFGYLDSILDSWRKDSVKTREDAFKNKEEFVKNKEKMTAVIKKEQTGKKVIENKIRNLNEFIE